MWLSGLGKWDLKRAAVPNLLLVLSDHEELWPRAKAAYSLGAIGDTRAKGALITALKDTEGNVRSAALDALVSLKEPIPEQEVFFTRRNGFRLSCPHFGRSGFEAVVSHTRRIGV